MTNTQVHTWYLGRHSSYDVNRCIKYIWWHIPTYTPSLIKFPTHSIVPHNVTLSSNNMWTSLIHLVPLLRTLCKEWLMLMRRWLLVDSLNLHRYSFRWHKRMQEDCMVALENRVITLISLKEFPLRVSH